MLASLLSLVLAASPEPDWARAVPEYRQMVSDLVGLDTTNPPGNEALAAEYLKRVFDREGISSEIYRPAAGRANLVARLKGLGSRRPLLLVGHLDVVGVERARWSSDPFVLSERDGHLHGRGVIDDKGMVAAEAMTLILLKRLGVPLSRDVILLAECDEESAGAFGVAWMLEHQRQAIDAEYALNEGGRTILAGDGASGQVAYLGVQTAEKRSINYRIVARGTSGHASMPRPDNPIAALARAISRVSDPPFPPALTAETRAFFPGVAPSQPEPVARAMAAVATPGETEAAAAVLAADLMYNAMLRHTVSATMIEGGFRANVIPAEAAATANVRLLPGADPEAMRAELTRRIGDPAVEVTFTPPARPEPPAVPFSGAVVDAVRTVAARLLPGAAVVPVLSTGATDSATLRAAGIAAYGVLPFPLTTADAGRMHGNDERMPTASLERGLKLTYGIVVEVAGAR
jgi:acetylornithine deacetylase/succinyl-diaminopimelate desuccinylase-like protein